MKQTLTLLRRILVAALLSFGVHFIAFAICWIFRDPLEAAVDDLTRRFNPLSDIGSMAAQLYGPLNTALSGALLLSSPFIIGFWLFNLSGRRSRRYQVTFVLSCMALAACGALCGCYVALPLAASLPTWATALGLPHGENLHDLTLHTVAGVGLAFEAPAVIFALQADDPSVPQQGRSM